MRIAFTTFGCKINQYDTEAMRQEVARDGNNIVVPFDGDADVFVINTCSVTGKSDYQCRQAIRSAVRRKQGARVIVTGCYAETRPEEIRSIPGVSLVLGNADKTDIARYCSPQEDGATARDVQAPITTEGRTRTVLKVQDGCDNRCTYCIVPIARGRSRSIDQGTVRDSFLRAVDGGAPEVVVSGIHIGTYGRDLAPQRTLGGLLKELASVRGSARIRLSSIEPGEISEDIIALLGKGLCRHLHIPLQSGDDKILKAMDRHYSARDYRDLALTLSEKVPGLAIGTDIMVGFPGEGEGEFENTLRLVEELPISHLHVFSYSPRPGTAAALMDGQVSAQEKKLRNKTIRDIGIKKNIHFRTSQVGLTQDVVIEDWVPGQGAIGFTDNYIRVAVPDAGPEIKGKSIKTIIKDVAEERTIALYSVTY